jgi:hypothetical protein
VRTLNAFHFNKKLFENGNAMLYAFSFKSFICCELAAAIAVNMGIAGEHLKAEAQ